MHPLDVLARGGRVAVEAVPGAGKTRLLLAACEGGGVASLVLAYNTQLAAAVTRALEEREDTNSICLTFHALCGRCLAPARDDAQLEAAVDAAERGRLVPRDVPDVTRVLVDEAQDVRPLYARLLRVLGLARDGVAMLVAGDRAQLIYDFDPDYPASLQLLDAPHELLGGKEAWHHVTLDVSYRLTHPIASLVNAVFGTSIVAKKEGPVVEVRTASSAFKLADVLRDVLGDKDNDDLLLLVDRRRGNRPLQTLLNTLSREGRKVHVHGVDADEATREGKLRCATWWGAKGLECDTAVVLLPSAAPRNPTYVALTRARRRLVLVLDAREPHAAVSAAVAALSSSSLVDMTTPKAAQAVALGQTRDAAASLRPVEWSARQDALRCLDRHAPRPQALAAATEKTPCAQAAEEEGEEGDRAEAVRVTVEGREEDVRGAALRVALVAAEARATGRVRAMEDVLHPTRLDADQRDAAVRAGLAARPVGRYASDDSLLAPDLRAAATAAYARLVAKGGEEDKDDLAEVALATLAWDGFDHVMRQHRPVHAWAAHPTVARATERAMALLPAAEDGARYDVRLVARGAHVRVHATTPRACYHAVWGRTSADVSEAAVRAALHPQRRCVLVDLATGAADVVEAHDPATLLGEEAE